MNLIVLLVIVLRGLERNLDFHRLRRCCGLGSCLQILFMREFRCLVDEANNFSRLESPSMPLLSSVTVQDLLLKDE